MVAQSSPRPDRSLPPAPASRIDRDQVAWLVLSNHALGLPEVVGSGRVMIVSDPAVLRKLLMAHEPRIVVCAEPPADQQTVAFVALERRRRPGLRAVHLAPPDAVERRLESLGNGFDDALATSTSPLELVGRLRWLDPLSSTAAGSHPLLPVADGLDLDPIAHVLRRGTEIVHLRPKEYGLLSVLASHPGRAYSRRELLDLVWGSDREGDTRTVDVHVRWLRSKIEQSPDHPVHLVTVRSLGYRLDAPRR